MSPYPPPLSEIARIQHFLHHRFFLKKRTPPHILPGQGSDSTPSFILFIPSPHSNAFAPSPASSSESQTLHIRVRAVGSNLSRAWNMDLHVLCRVISPSRSCNPHLPLILVGILFGILSSALANHFSCDASGLIDTLGGVGTPT